MAQCNVCGATVTDVSQPCPDCGSILSESPPGAVEPSPPPAPAPAPVAGTAATAVGQEAPARLVLIRGGQVTDVVYPLGSRVVIGRFDPDKGPVDVDLAQVPEGQYVSRQHAEVYQDAEGKWYVKDLGSANGTFVKKQATGPGGFTKITGEQRLQSGDEVSFGNARFRFEVSS